MRESVRRFAVVMVSGALAACVAPGTAFNSSDLGRGTDSAAPAATPVGSASAPALSVAVASLAANLPAGPIAASRMTSGMFDSTPAKGGDETAAAPAEPAGTNADQEIAKKLSNPIANLISVPFQSNYDTGIGPDRNGSRYQLNVQPVIPISLNDDWNLISRTIMPVIDEDNVVPDTRQTGFGDITQSLFFSPKQPTDCGWIWGAGPVLLVPTGQDKYLGADKWGSGPTAVLLKQESGWTVGVLAKRKSKQYTLLVTVDLTQRTRVVNKATATANDVPPAKAASSTEIKLPRNRHGVAGVTG